ncbi:MAG: hypothetical protein D6769_00360 [Methanobacteriota archaeon]|nr:MAG: hypothetical protein D6769_00360 [Euryarchaeota archaeon]
MSVFELIGKIFKKLELGEKLDKVELALLKSVLKKDFKRAAVFAKAFIIHYSSLPDGLKKKAKPARIKLELITTKAINNIVDGREAFNEDEKEVLIKLFNDIGLDGPRVARSYINNFNVLFGYAFKEGLATLDKEDVLQPSFRKSEEEKEKLKL